MKKLLKIVVVLLGLAALSLGINFSATPPAQSAEPHTLVGKVVRVADGDTLTVLKDKKEYKIRLNGIDAPERSQPFGAKAREYLRAMVNQKTVTVTLAGKDRYGRYLGTVAAPGYPDVNSSMLQAGFAWHYKQYSKSAHYAKLEQAARADKKGLWQDTNPTAPWDYRHAQNAPKNNKQNT